MVGTLNFLGLRRLGFFVGGSQGCFRVDRDSQPVRFHEGNCIAYDGGLGMFRSGARTWLAPTFPSSPPREMEIEGGLDFRLVGSLSSQRLYIIRQLPSAPLSLWSAAGVIPPFHLRAETIRGAPVGFADDLLLGATLVTGDAPAGRASRFALKADGMREVAEPDCAVFASGAPFLCVRSNGVLAGASSEPEWAPRRAQIALEGLVGVSVDSHLYLSLIHISEPTRPY